MAGALRRDPRRAPASDCGKKAVDRLDQPALSVVNSAWALRGPLVEMTAARSDGPMRSTSLLRNRPRGRGAAGIEADVIVVQHDKQYPAVFRLIVGSDRHARAIERWNDRAWRRRRQIHRREGQQLDRLAVLGHLEILASQSAHRQAGLVGNDDVDFDEVDARLEWSAATAWARSSEEKGAEISCTGRYSSLGCAVSYSWPCCALVR